MQRFTNMVLVSAESQCAPEECAYYINNTTRYKNFIKFVCCCTDFKFCNHFLTLIL
jgi:hypothetical protein